jgi:hypothetical protein
MKGKLITNFKKWSTEGEIPEEGLCTTLRYTPYKETLEQFVPTREDVDTLHKEDKPFIYWAYGIKFSDEETKERRQGLTPLRQTILALICAIHDEV